MNLTLLGGVKRITNKLKTNFNKTKKYLSRERLIAISMLYKVISMSIVLAVFPIGTMPIEAKGVKHEIQVWNSEMHLDVQKSVPVELTIKRPEIILGESIYQKSVREQKEAEERTLAENKANNKAQSRDVVSRETSRTYLEDASLEEKRSLAKRAAAAYGIDWRLVEAVWQIESGKSWDTQVTSYAGAQGPMQFMPGTWRSVGVDASGDGVADANNAEDAVYSGAKYLALNGAASGNIDHALYAYNHAGWYVAKVKNVMNSIAE